MVVNVFMLTAGGRLEKYKDKILKVAKKSVKIIVKKIPLPDVDVVFYDNPKENVRHLGISGYAQTPNMVLVSLNPRFKRFERTINDEIIRTLAHEFHHCMRMRAVGYGSTLLKQ